MPVSQMRAVKSSLAVTTKRLSRLKAIIVRYFVWPFSSRSKWPVVASHNRAMLWSPIVAISFPSGL